MLAADGLAVAGRLTGVSASLRAGQVTAICGPNGAGKSTLLACLAALIEPGEGTVTLDGSPLAALAPAARARRIGYLPQQGELAWDVSVEVLVSLGRIPWKGAGSEAAVDSAIAEMDLAGLRRRPVSSLSGGERARALMARVLAGEPDWILADEPLASLDLGHAADLAGCLARQAQAGRGVVVVLHDLAAAMNRADRVLVLNQGRLVADDVPSAALDEAVIKQVWQVNARWLGTAGEKALSHCP